MNRIYEKLYHKNLALTKKKIKASVAPDNMVIQCIGNIEELDRAANILVKRLREWYELYNPEFSRQVTDHEIFVSMVVEGRDKKSRDSMGADFVDGDLYPVMSLAKSADGLYKLRRNQEKYLDTIMKNNAPNLTAVAGSLVSAKLLAHAGSFRRLAELTSSTIQLLGAEKALFRHMKTGAKSPKHGLILQHPLLSNAKAKDRGRVARALADKIALAAKVDFFNGEFIGDKLRKDLEKKFNYSC